MVTAAMSLNPVDADVVVNPRKLALKRRLCVPDIVHGIPTVKSESVTKTFLAMRREGVQKILCENAEKIYKSVSTEPLGTSVRHGYVLPPPSHAFGIKTDSRESGIKTLICPETPTNETESVRSMYRRTHHDYDAGEQLDRQYQLPPQISQNENFRYGLARKSNRDTAADILGGI
jgi:hypothetical protein